MSAEGLDTPPLDAFVAALAPGAATPALESAVAGALERATSAWPGLAGVVTPARLAAFLGERVRRTAAEGSDPAVALEGLHVEDLLLTCACLCGSAAALRSFEETVIDRVRLYVHRLGLSPAQVDELRQRLREHLLVARPEGPPLLADYSGTGPLDGWARITARRMALRLRTEGPAGHESPVQADALDVLCPVGDPEMDYLRARYREPLREAFSSAMQALETRERTLLRLSSIGGKSVDALGRMYGVHRATAARWVQAARERLLGLTRQNLMSRLAIGDTECRSLLGLLQSQLDVTVERLLGPPRPRPS